MNVKDQDATVLESTGVHQGIFANDQSIQRYVWCSAIDAHRTHHNHAWGFPVSVDRRIFEKVCLEGFQAGLSWLTTLNKPQAFRQAFAGFDMEQVAKFDEADVKRRVLDAGIVRVAGSLAIGVSVACRKYW
jgi:DNA-3-methyladenine glycosylase I